MLRSEGFALFVAVCNRPIDRNALIAHLAESIPGAVLRTVTLGEDTVDPLAEIEREANTSSPGPVMLVGLENAVPSSADDHPVLHSLNLRRQEWPRKVPQPVVLWIPEYLLGLLGRAAPDFLDWRSDTIHFDTLVDRDLREFRSGEWAGGTDAGIPVAARRERIKELRSRIAVSPQSDDPVVLAAHSDWLNEIGNHRQQLGEYSEARRMYETAIAIGEKHFDPDHPTLATSYSNLAAILKDLGDLPEARRLTERAIEMGEKHFDPDHPTLATSYSNLAQILKALGELPEARRLMERAIEIWEKHFDPGHPTLATSYSNLATILHDLGDLPKARRQMERAIEIWEKHFDPGHPTLATSYSNLATILHDLGDLPKARRLMELAIEIDEKHFDPDHPTLATSYHNLAGIAFGEGKPAEALGLQEKALAILLKHFDDDHPRVKISRKFLARYRSAVE